MSIEQIDEKLKCIMIQVNDVANELYQKDPQHCSRLKVAGLNIGCVRADIERAAELVEGQKTNHQQLKHAIDLLAELSRVLELYAPNDVLHSQVDEFINSVR